MRARARSHAHATRTHARRHAQANHARLAATCKRGWDGPRHCKRERIPTFQGRSHWVTEWDARHEYGRTTAFAHTR
jgi:hypothetical protein